MINFYVAHPLKVDTRMDIRTRDPLTYITPNVDIKSYEAGWAFKTEDGWENNGDGVGGRLYADPYPLSENQFLVACKSDESAEWSAPEAYGIYLIDSEGNQDLIHMASGNSCFVPIPLRARPTPPVPVTPRQRDLEEQNLAACVVTDIYRGMEGIERGEVKYIRVNEQLPRPWGSNRIIPKFRTSATRPSMDAHMWIRIQHGIVPVEEDGSAYFIVPADRSIFLQALDENYMELQRERTYINYRPGEVRSCVGCHERTMDAPGYNADAGEVLALNREPSIPGPQPGEETGKRLLSYAHDVQPVWDKHCISCHGAENPDGALNLTGAITQQWTKSYEELIQKDLAGIFVNEDSPNPELDGLYRRPKTLGAHTSKLAKVLLEGHEGVELPLEDMIKVTTWLDSNTQYYGTYYGRRHSSFKDHPNFRPTHTIEQALAAMPSIPWEER